DPDITHGALLQARVGPGPATPGTIILEGGPGVGRVTRPGLGLAVGGPAINPVPRRNIDANLREVAGDWLRTRGLAVTLTIADGERLARRTLNPRLGITGGLSILGTSGIVYPYSTAAYKEAVRQSIASAAAMGLTGIVLTTGRRTERFARQRLPDWPVEAFVQMGDFVGAALEGVAAAGFRQVVVAAMAGKLAKIGQGVANTHAHKVPVDMERVARLAREAGADDAEAGRIARGVTVRHAAEVLAERGLAQAFYRRLVAGVEAAVVARVGSACAVNVLAFDDNGILLEESGNG
ncbi:MAG: cobalamin biosynthesis protein CbiD, partial [Magnetococcales bacterium]|nr:cobalamin biosynthesis protein CbiD [Magnetococcales bacterium]